jgi:hypothetical protein
MRLPYVSTLITAQTKPLLELFLNPGIEVYSFVKICSIYILSRLCSDSQSIFLDPLLCFLVICADIVFQV